MSLIQTLEESVLQCRTTLEKYQAEREETLLQNREKLGDLCVSALKHFGELYGFLAKTCSQHSSQFQPLSQPFPRSEAIAIRAIYFQSQTSLEELNTGFSKIREAIEDDATKHSRYHAEFVVPLRSRIKASNEAVAQQIIESAQEIVRLERDVRLLVITLDSDRSEQEIILEKESRLQKARDVVDKVAYSTLAANVGVCATVFVFPPLFFVSVGLSATVFGLTGSLLVLEKLATRQGDKASTLGEEVRKDMSRLRRAMEHKEELEDSQASLRCLTTTISEMAAQSTALCNACSGIQTYFGAEKHRMGLNIQAACKFSVLPDLHEDFAPVQEVIEKVGAAGRKLLAAADEVYHRSPLTERQKWQTGQAIKGLKRGIDGLIGSEESWYTLKVGLILSYLVCGLVFEICSHVLAKNVR